MNHDEFDRRWKIGAAAARSAPPADGEIQAPPGFSSRVVALSREPVGTSAALALIWQTFSLRALGMVAAVLFIATILVMWTEPAPPTLSPPIAESVGEQLPWFESL